LVIIAIGLRSGIVGTHATCSSLMHMGLVVWAKTSATVAIVLVIIVTAVVWILRMIVMMRPRIGLRRIITCDMVRRRNMIPTVRLWRVIMGIHYWIALRRHIMRAIVAMVWQAMVLVGMMIRHRIVSVHML